jgi:hypothetical protein
MAIFVINEMIQLFPSSPITKNFQKGMVLMKKTLILLLFLLCYTYSAGNAKTYQIIPGYGIDGVIYIGNTKEQVLKSWGEPAMIVPMENILGPAAKAWQAYLYPKYMINLIFSKEDKIIFIGAKSDLYSTPEGIKAGSSLDTVVKTYGNDYFKEASNDKECDYKIKYDKLGYEFSIKNDYVFEIVIWVK